MVRKAANKHKNIPTFQMTNASGSRSGLQWRCSEHHCTLPYTPDHTSAMKIMQTSPDIFIHIRVKSYNHGLYPPFTMNSLIKSDTVRFKLSWQTVVLAFYLIAVWVRDIHEVYTGEYMISSHPELNIQHLQPLIHPHPYSNTPHLSPEIHYFCMTITPIFILAMLYGVVFLSHRVGQPHSGVDFYWSLCPSAELCRPVRVSNGKHMYHRFPHLSFNQDWLCTLISVVADGEWGCSPQQQATGHLVNP